MVFAIVLTVFVMTTACGAQGDDMTETNAGTAVSATPAGARTIPPPSEEPA